MCCRVPDFLIGLAERQQPTLVEKPVALLGADERVLAASPEARETGICLHMPARQARMRCPDVCLQPLDMEACQSEQDAFAGKLAECGLPVESPSWGVAYVDLHAVASTSQAVRPYCADLGAQVRGVLGESLVPSIGWDTGKFTARAAATRATPGHMRLIDRSNEESFLQPLSIALLPLPPLALQQLAWLGIRTLGQFARLPATAVWQRFGTEGKLAQKWAQGRDERPVRTSVQDSAPPISIDFDPPTAQCDHVLEAVISVLRPSLSALANQLEGCRRLRLELRFEEESTRTIDCTFVEPLSGESRLRATVSHQLQVLNWPAELSGVQVALVEFGELVPHQLTLFETDEDRSPLLELAKRLSGRYGAIFLQSQLSDEGHPLSERRPTLSALSEGCAA